MSALDDLVNRHDNHCPCFFRNSRLEFCICNAINAINELTSLRTRIAELEAMTTWQPIETIPKKEGVVIVYTEYGETYSRKIYATDNDYSHITHWMPKPQPPKEGEK